MDKKYCLENRFGKSQFNEKIYGFKSIILNLREW